MTMNDVDDDDDEEENYDDDSDYDTVVLGAQFEETCQRHDIIILFFAALAVGGLQAH